MANLLFSFLSQLLFKLAPHSLFGFALFLRFCFFSCSFLGFLSQARFCFCTHLRLGFLLCLFESSLPGLDLRVQFGLLFSIKPRLRLGSFLRGSLGQCLLFHSLARRRWCRGCQRSEIEVLASIRHILLWRRWGGNGFGRSSTQFAVRIGVADITLFEQAMQRLDQFGFRIFAQGSLQIGESAFAVNLLEDCAQGAWQITRCARCLAHTFGRL